jgi:hypothetical protein
MAKDGHGLTLTFSTSSTFSPEIISASGIGESYETLDSTHHGTSDATTNTPTTLSTANDITFECYHDTNASPPTGVQQTITIGQTNWGSDLSFTGTMISYEIGEITSGERMTATFVIRPSGEISNL